MPDLKSTHEKVQLLPAMYHPIYQNRQLKNLKMIHAVSQRSQAWVGFRKCYQGAMGGKEQGMGAQLKLVSGQNLAGAFCLGAEQGHGRGQLPPASLAQDHRWSWRRLANCVKPIRLAAVCIRGVRMKLSISLNSYYSQVGMQEKRYRFTMHHITKVTRSQYRNLGKVGTLWH